MERSHNLKDRVLGSILLISGCCIGAGMLGLPSHTAEVGFFLSTVLFVLCWAFMLVTGLLLVEVNLGCAKEGNLMSMAEKTLGKGAKIGVALLFGFLFYSLMVAYSSGSGLILKDSFYTLTHIHITLSQASFLFVLFTALFVWVGTKACDNLNRVLMVGLALTYSAILFLCADEINPKLLTYVDTRSLLFTVPVMIVSFGYHNLIPSLTSYLKSRPKAILQAIAIGSAIPLFVYIAWDAMVLGLVPAELFIVSQEDGGLITQALRHADVTGTVFQIMQMFSFFAIVTSFLGVALSFVDFIIDGLKLKKTPLQRFIATVIALLPPYLFSLGSPKLFLRALDIAGGFGASLLFGVIPVLMVVEGRRKKLWEGEIIPGGFITLFVVMLFAIIIFVTECIRTIGFVTGG
jgi:tyrosine-specific transport protein